MLVIKKVSHIQKKVAITSYNEETQTKESIESNQPPLPEFDAALQGFVAIINGLPFDKSLVQSVEVKSVHFRVKDGDILSFKVGLTVKQKPDDDDDSGRTINFVTDAQSVEVIDEYDDIISEMIEQAKRYLSGERQQLQMDFDPENDDESDYEHDTVDNEQNRQMSIAQ